MAEPMLQPVPALAGRLEPVGSTRPAGVTAAERHGLALATVSARRGMNEPLAAEIERRFGLALPSGPYRAGGATSFLGIGPGRWLAVAEDAVPGFAGELAVALAGLASVVDQSAGLVVLRVSGPKARETFAKGLPIDLDPSEFPADGVAVSSLAHLGVTLWRADADAYDIAFFRSLAGSVAHWLTNAAAEFGLEVGRG